MEWGLERNDLDQVIDDLVESDFINEDRFLYSYVRGKFNSNQWGKRKIYLSLKEKRFDDERIALALKKIDSKDYEKMAKILLQRKSTEIDEPDPYRKRSKLYYFMNSRGFEAEVFMPLFDQLEGTK